MSLPQLPLSLVPPRRMRFGNFVTGPNGSTVATLRAGPGAGEFYLLCGPPGSGKSHLAAAVHAHWVERGLHPAWIPGRARDAAGLLETPAGPAVVVEDIEALAGCAESERALFNALNRYRAARARVLLTGSGELPFELPDLASRIGQAARLALRPLAEPDLEALIDQLVEDFQVVPGRGLSDYLLRRGPRGAAGLVALFERMARRAQAERRVVSVPLARECLAP